MRVSHFAYIVVAITTFVVATYLLLNDEAQLPSSPSNQLQKTEEFPLAEKPDRPPVRKEEARLQEDDLLAKDMSGKPARLANYPLQSKDGRSLKRSKSQSGQKLKC